PTRQASTTGRIMYRLARPAARKGRLNLVAEGLIARVEDGPPRSGSSDAASGLPTPRFAGRPCCRNSPAGSLTGETPPQTGIPPRAPSTGAADAWDRLRYNAAAAR